MAMFAAKKLADPLSLYQLASFGIMFVLCIFASTDLWRKLCAKIQTKETGGKILAVASPAVQLVLLLLCTCYLVDATYNPFLYFRF